MELPRSVLLLTAGLFLCACSGGDTPPAPAATPAPTQTTQVATPEVVTPPPAPPSAEPSPVVNAEPPPAPVAPAPVAPPADAAPVATSGTESNYTVQCAPGAGAAEQCSVDKDTYIGWRTFASQCQVCHGGSALGSTFAPNLLDRFHERVDHPRFVEVVTNGFRGQVGAMPAWKGNPNVMPHVDQLYRYLKARADGALPPGRPTRQP
jgi:mono/diheme cytochrome c family protein